MHNESMCAFALFSALSQTRCLICSSSWPGPRFAPGSLRDVIDKRLLGGGPPLGEVEALVIFAGVCRGVEALHKHTPPWAHRLVIVGLI